MSSLYTINAEYALIAAELIEAGGELTDSLELALQINEAELQEKSLHLAYIIKDLQYQQDYCKSEIERITKRKKSIEKSQERLEDAIKAAMLQHDVTVITKDTIRISLRRSQAVVITDERLIPDFLKEADIKYKIDKAELMRLIKDGTEILGAAIEIRQNLQIR